MSATLTYASAAESLVVKCNSRKQQFSCPVNELSRISFIGLFLSLFQIEGMRRGSRRVHADVRALPVPGNTSRSGDLDRPGLRVGGERLRLQAEKFGKRVNGRAAGCSEFLIVCRIRRHLGFYSLSRQENSHSEHRVLSGRSGYYEQFRAL